MKKIIKFLCVCFFCVPLFVNASENDENVVVYNNGSIIEGHYAEPTREGYEFAGWYTNAECTNGNEFDPNVDAPKINIDTDIYANWKANTNTKYVIKHYTENLDNNEYSLREVESLLGITDAYVTPETKAYEGFLSPDKQSVKIKGDGSLVVEYYYTRNSYTVTLSKGTGIDTVSGDGNYKYGETVTISATVLSGYEWLEWTGSFETEMQEYTFTMPAENVTITANGIVYSPPQIFAVYSSTDNSLSFYNRSRVPAVGSTYENKAVTAVYTGLENTYYYILDLTIIGGSYTEVLPGWKTYKDNIKSVYVIDEISPKNMSYWFYNLRKCETWNLSKLNTSQTTNMSYCFQYAGYDAASFNLDLSMWNTSQVTNMSKMFDNSGYNASSFKLNLTGWNTSKVTNMYSMFAYAGYKAALMGWSITGITSWNTSSVTDMSYMFAYAGNSSLFTLDLSGWNVSKVTTYISFTTTSYLHTITSPAFP